MGVIAGTLTFITCIGSFTYLVADNHERAAYSILGAAVLSVVTVILKQKL